MMEVYSCLTETPYSTSEIAELLRRGKPVNQDQLRRLVATIAHGMRFDDGDNTWILTDELLRNYEQTINRIVENEYDVECLSEGCGDCECRNETIGGEVKDQSSDDGQTTENE